MPRYFDVDGRPQYLVGTNYWPGNRANRMWSDWDPARYAADIAHMARLGLRVYRVFLQTADFTPTHGNVDPRMLARLDELLAISLAHGVKVMPTLFVGPASGIDWDFPWRHGRDLYTDPQALQIERRYVQTLARRYRDHPALFGWILTNEISVWGATSPQKAQAWAAAMYQNIREAGDAHLVGTGDGARSEAKKNYDGFRTEWIYPYVDYFGCHLYNYYDYANGDNDALRWSYAHSGQVKYVSIGKPVFVEEFGSSTTLDSEENQAGFYRNVLFGTLINGACGAMPWGLSDFGELEDRVPYTYYINELHYGMLRSDGSEKPAAREMARFARIAQRLDLTRFRLDPPRAAIVVPSRLIADYPHDRLDRFLEYRVLQTSFTLAKTGGCDVGFVRERPDPYFFDSSPLPEEAFDFSPYRLLILPNTWAMLTGTWRQLHDYAAAGGTVYVSFSGRRGGLHCQIFESLFGARHQLRYGISDLPRRSAVTLRFIRPLVGFGEGEEIVCPVAGTPPDTAYLPLETTTAEVIAVDDEGRPALIVNRIGQGRVVLVTYPLEYYAFWTPDGNTTTALDSLYLALRELAGIRPPADCANRFIETGTFTSVDGAEQLVVLVNHAWTTEEGPLRLGGTATNWETGEPLAEPAISLPPKEAAVLHVVTKG
ncbi:MAG: cellulase family glycosylhydrolase [Chloroflexi bacterium]|nr:cellulase family glycosylhydrolase [Chloroflexota bacterium]